MRVTLKVLLVLALFAIGAESLFRVGILLKIPTFRDPDLYTDWTSDEDYWKLRHLWVKRVANDNAELADPMLGWALPKSTNNPLGAHTDQAYTVDYQTKSLLFFGDVFVQGTTKMSQRIPQLVGQKISLPSYNLGVKGYGWDQTLLRMQQASHPFRTPTLVVGLLSVGIDRSLLGFRTGLKPYYVASNGRVQLRGIPLRSDIDQWILENPPHIQSYALSFFARRIRMLHSGSPLEVGDRREEKRELASALLNEMVELANAEKSGILFILFYNKEELAYEGWREKFMKEELKLRNAEYVDTKRILIQKARDTHQTVSAFYDAAGCLNEKGNEAVSTAVADRLKVGYFATSSAPG